MVAKELTNLDVSIQPKLGIYVFTQSKCCNNVSMYKVCTEAVNIDISVYTGKVHVLYYHNSMHELYSCVLCEPVPMGYVLNV